MKTYSLRYYRGDGYAWYTKPRSRKWQLWPAYVRLRLKGIPARRISVAKFRSY